MRVVQEAKPDHPDNTPSSSRMSALTPTPIGTISAKSISTIKRWSRSGLAAGDEDDGEGSGEPRRFDIGMFVDNESSARSSTGHFSIPKTIAFLTKCSIAKLALGLRLRDLIAKEALREKLRTTNRTSRQNRELCRSNRRAGGFRRESAFRKGRNSVVAPSADGPRLISGGPGGRQGN